MSLETLPATEQAAAQPSAVPAVPIWRLSVNQYHAMVAAGILTDDDPVELLEGWLVPKMPKNPAHRLSTQLTRTALERVLPVGWFVDAQEPITLPDSEPEPDVVVVRGDRRQYQNRHPGPGDVALVIEVADTTLQRDRTIKKRLYARAGIPHYWIVNVIDRQVETFTRPQGGNEADYGDAQIHRAPGDVWVVLDGRPIARVAAGDLLP